MVMHKGRVITEKYFGASDAQIPHIAFSVTKSFVGTLAAILAEQGKLDPAALVTKYVPELKDGAYADATVRQVMDMTVGVKYSEVNSNPKADVWDYARAGGLNTALRDLARVGEGDASGRPLQRPANHSGGRGGRHPQRRRPG